jgi:hypothetical protein
MQRKDKDMNGLKCFMRGYMNISMHIKFLDLYIYNFKYEEEKETRKELINNLEDIMESARYEEAKKIIYDYGDRIFSKRKTEGFIRYLHARLKNKKPRLTLGQMSNVR